MRYQDLATDNDGTLTDDGRVDHATLAALDRFAGRGSEGKLNLRAQNLALLLQTCDGVR